MTRYPSVTDAVLSPARNAGARAALARLLRAAVSLLDSLSARLEAGAGTTTARHSDLPSVEFSAEAGALEGALYVDGRLVGWIDGVKRL